MSSSALAESRTANTKEGHLPTAESPVFIVLRPVSGAKILIYFEISLKKNKNLKLHTEKRFLLGHTDHTDHTDYFIRSHGNHGNHRNFSILPSPFTLHHD